MDRKFDKKVLIVGAGLAGSEAAIYLANRGVQVILCESKTVACNSAQKISSFAELVCTNSLKSKNFHSAHGILKFEMEKLDSVMIGVGKEVAVPAGDALAVDRDLFSKKITEIIMEHPLIDVHAIEVGNPFEIASRFECDYIIIASGPLTNRPLETWIQENVSADDFYFYDAIAPVVDGDSLDYSKLYYKDRYKKNYEGQADYLNAPLNKEEYENFITELVKSEKVEALNFEEYKFFESCLPIDTMAQRGVDTARFSCMKPVGLEKEDGELPYAVVQLRKENLLGSAYNLVGFQTKMTYSEQKRIFKMIPGFENANFIRFGSIHRNSFLDASKTLNFDLRSKRFDNLYFAGQITGVEGYTESASMGLYVAYQLLLRLKGENQIAWPKDTAIGALVHYLMTQTKPVPTNINFGLFPSVRLSKNQLKHRKYIKKMKKRLIAERSQKSFLNFSRF